MINRISSEKPEVTDLLNRRTALNHSQEELVVDDRDCCRPSEFVQRKLQSALPAAHIVVSSLHSHRFVRR